MASATPRCRFCSKVSASSAVEHRRADRGVHAVVDAGREVVEQQRLQALVDAPRDEREIVGGDDLAGARRREQHDEGVVGEREVGDDVEAAQRAADHAARGSGDGVEDLADDAPAEDGLETAVAVEARRRGWRPRRAARARAGWRRRRRLATAAGDGPSLTRLRRLVCAPPEGVVVRRLHAAPPLPDGAQVAFGASFAAARRPSRGFRRPSAGGRLGADGRPAAASARRAGSPAALEPRP